MPGAGDDMFYSFDMGPVHFVAVSSEYYYYLNYGLKMVGNQFRWLEKDLKVCEWRVRLNSLRSSFRIA